MAVIADELDKCEYPEPLARIAEHWITRGAPVIYGKLTLADFYPTEKQIAEIDANVESILRNEYWRGWQDGYSHGWNKGFDSRPQLQECKNG